MTKKLAKAVDEYLVWIISAGYASGTIMIHERLLNHFQNFIINRNISWEQVFTYDTLNSFEKHCNLYFAANVLRSLSRYLFKQKLISDPIKKPRVRLPEIYDPVDLLSFQKNRHNILCVMFEYNATYCVLIFKTGVNQQSHI